MKLVSIIAILATVNQAAAADIGQELDQVVVTASRVEEKLKEAPVTINVIDDKEVEKIKYRNPTDMLYRIPGVISGDFGGESELTSIRVQTHFGNPYTIVLLDGVPVSNYGSGSSGQFAEIDSNNISRIEVIKGPASALYGSNAIGGVINVISKNPSSKPQVKLWSEYGRGDTWRSGISGGDSGEKANFNVSLNNISNKGTRAHSDLEKRTGNVKFQLPFDESLLSFKLDLLSTDADSPGNLSKEEFEQNWMHSYGLAFSEKEKIASTISYSYFFDEAELKTSLSLRDLDSRSIPTYRFRDNLANNTFTSFLYNTEEKSTNLNFLYSRDLNPLSSKIIIGLDTEKSNQDFFSQDISGTIDPTASLKTYNTTYTILGIDKDYDIDTKMYAPFIQVQVTPIDKLKITAAGRYDSVKYEVEDKNPTPASKFSPATNYTGKASFNQFSPKVGITYDFTSWFNGFFSYSKGFVVPTTSQLYTSTGANKDLNPENAENFEVGIRNSLLQGKLGLDLALYTMDITNKILSNGSGWGATSINAGEASTDGFEATAVYAPIDMVKLTMAYSYAINEFDKYTPAQPEYDDHTLPRSPDHHINVRLAVTPLKGLEVELELDDISSQYHDVDNLAQYRRPALVNLRGTYSWHQWSAWAHLKNMTNEQYSSYISGDGSSDTTRDLYPGSPISLFAGISYKWGK